MTNLETEKHGLTDMEKDVIGEVMNISMGAAATAMSTILDKKVSITTPRIEMVPIEEFEFSYLEPAMGVLIKYVEGINGSNVLIMKEEDLKKILCHLLSIESVEELEFDEISMSAICEIMNQMMGSASSALASFFSRPINISIPEILDFNKSGNIREIFSLTGENVASIKFNLCIDGLMESEFISAMEPRLAKEMVLMSLGINDIEEEKEETVPPDPAPQAKELQHQELQPQNVNVQEPKAASSKDSEPKQLVNAMKYEYRQLDDPADPAEQSGNNNLDLIMSVPIQITVELGRTKKKIRDIVELTQGNVIELDKQAGDQVDIMANGRLIAKGDVVVVDDNYSVRITEIIKAKDWV